MPRLTNEEIQKRKAFLTGRTFGGWTVIESLAADKQNPYTAMVLARCECGLEKPISAQNLVYTDRGQRCQSCSMVKHHDERGRITTPQRTYWIQLRNRGALPKIWLNYDRFVKDVGVKLEGRFLNRHDRTKPLGPNNWYWSDTPSNLVTTEWTKVRGGPTGTYEEIAKHYGVTRQRIEQCVKSGAINGCLNCGKKNGRFPKSYCSKCFERQQRGFVRIDASVETCYRKIKLWREYLSRSTKEKNAYRAEKCNEALDHWVERLKQLTDSIKSEAV